MPWNCTISWSSGLSPRGPLMNSTFVPARATPDQQRLVGELAGQPVRGVVQHHIHPDPGDQVTQPLQRGPHQRRPRVPSSSNTHSSGSSAAARRGPAAPRSATRSSGHSSARRWTPGRRSRARHGVASFLAGPNAGPPLRYENGVGHRQVRGRMTTEDVFRLDRPIATCGDAVCGPMRETRSRRASPRRRSWSRPRVREREPARPGRGHLTVNTTLASGTATWPAARAWSAYRRACRAETATRRPDTDGVATACPLPAGQRQR